MEVEIKRLNDKAILPEYASVDSAGMDLRACIDNAIILAPGDCKIIPSGIAINMKNSGMMAQIVPRSGLGARDGIVIGNLTGIIDSDYQGEIGLSMWNRSDKPFMIEPNMRLVQMIFVPILRVDLKEVNEFSTKTERGTGGFGSTGVK